MLKSVFMPRTTTLAFPLKAPLHNKEMLNENFAFKRSIDKIIFPLITILKYVYHSKCNKNFLFYDTLSLNAVSAIKIC